VFEDLLTDALHKTKDIGKYALRPNQTKEQLREVKHRRLTAIADKLRRQVSKLSGNTKDGLAAQARFHFLYEMHHDTTDDQSFQGGPDP